MISMHVIWTFFRDLHFDPHRSFCYFYKWLCKHDTPCLHFPCIFWRFGVCWCKSSCKRLKKNSSLFDCFVVSSFMLVNSLLVDSYIRSHQRLESVMPYMKYNMFIQKGARIIGTTFFKSCFAFQLVKFSTSPLSTFKASIRMKYWLAYKKKN